ncbi:MAG: alpha/beta fold hydrolase [Saprospiraceae bacterium]
MLKTIFLLQFGLLLTFSCGAQNTLGRWYSKITINDTVRHYLLDFRVDDLGYAGYLDIPSSNTFRIRLDTVGLDDQDSVYFSHSGLNLSFKGRLNENTALIQGAFSVEDHIGDLMFSRKPQVSRTQIIDEPLPYHIHDIYFYNSENTRLAGTLSLPKDQKEFPVVVLISGSGPQNRDEEILGHRPFGILADYLTRQGVAVLRYDDRGYGESEGQFRPATSLDYTDDALAAVQYLESNYAQQITQIGLVGHSEGGNIAPVAATRNPNIDFLVLLAAPGLSNYESYLVSLDIILQAYPETYDRDFPFFKSVYYDMATISDKAILKDSLQAKFSRITKLMSEEELLIYGGADNYIKGQVDYHTSDWYHYYLQFDVTPYLANLEIPILALNGDQDDSVESKSNLRGIKETLIKAGNLNFETVELKNVNHFFQESDNNSIESVYFNEVTFQIAALEKIAAWISQLN